MAIDTCIHCGETIKSGMLGSNKAFTEKQLFALAQCIDEVRAGACEECGDSLLGLPHKVANTISTTQRALFALMDMVPLASLHSPVGWEYETLGLVTGRSTTGTGMFSDVASAFTDLFGAQSKTYNSKLQSGENICRAALRLQAIEMGGNAVLGVDVDYAEVGGQRAMLMVCMTGTAVRLKNVEAIRPELADIPERVQILSERLKNLEKARTDLA